MEPMILRSDTPSVLGVNRPEKVEMPVLVSKIVIRL